MASVNLSSRSTIVYKNPIEINVKKDGTGDFTTIQAAINSITDATQYKPYSVLVHDDYDITTVLDLHKVEHPTELWESASAVTEHVALVVLKDWVNLIGVSRKIRLSVKSETSLTATSYQYIQPVWVHGNCKLDKLDLVIFGGRYACHQDNSWRGESCKDIDAKTEYYNVTCIHNGNSTTDGYPAGAWSSTAAMANGLSSGQHQVFDNVKWITKNQTPFYFHSDLNFEKNPVVEFNACKSLYLGAETTIRSSYYGDLGSGKKAKIKIKGSDFGTFFQTNETNTNTSQIMIILIMG